MKKYYFLLAVLTIAISCGILYKKMGGESLPEPTIPIKWLTIDEALQASKKDGKFVYIDFYTEWCGFCKKMDKTTYRDTALIRYINQHFHAVKLDAEAEIIAANGKDYHLNQQFNQFAVNVLNGNMAFPTSVIIDPSLSVRFRQPGYMDAITVRAVLTYFGEKMYEKNIMLEDFVNKFK